MQETKRLTPLRQVLTRNRLKQKDVADALGVGSVTVFNWYHGLSGPSGLNLTRLAEYLQQFEPGVTERFLVSQLPDSRVSSGQAGPLGGAPDA